MHFDDYRPVDYARLPRENATVSVLTFLAMFQGQPFDVQVSQSFHDGHPEVAWKRGAAIIGPVDGFWEQRSPIAAEDIRHMQSRVLQFVAHARIPEDQLSSVPLCPESWCRWIKTDSEAFAARRQQPVAPAALQRRPLPALPWAETGPEDEDQP